jgi:ribosomal protein S21
MFVAEKGGIFMTKVMVRNGNVDGALRTLKVDKDGSRKKLRENIEGYLKPGVKRRRKKEEGIRNTRKRNRRENRY